MTPLKKAAKIVNGNALRIDWEELISKEKLNFILGNPPFVGKQLQNADQKADMNHVLGDIKGAGVLDYVTAWYIKAAEFIQNSLIRCALVSTNSISQGEQVGVLWQELYQKYREEVNPKVNVFSVQVAGYNNSVIPENLYRGAILSGWTGKEPVFAKAIIETWDSIES